MRTVLIVVVATLLASASARFGEERERSPWEHARLMDRGRYLAHHVAMCVQCHTPRGADGALDMARLLQGGEVPLAAKADDLGTVLHAPALAGLPGYTEETAVRLLTEGISRDGLAPRGPMHAFRLQRGDAEAVVVYLSNID